MDWKTVGLMAIIALAALPVVWYAAVTVGPSGTTISEPTAKQLVERSDQIVADIRFYTALADASVLGTGALKATRLLGIGMGLFVGFTGGTYLSLRRERGRRS